VGNLEVQCEKAERGDEEEEKYEERMRNFKSKRSNRIYFEPVTGTFD
jgi:hypothetical protein